MLLIDFIEAAGNFSGKDTPFFGYLQHWSDNKVTGRQTYLLEGCREIKIYYKPATGDLVLRGSIMYFWQGHNFTFDKQGFIDAINYIGSLLKVNLWQMYLNILECGVIIEVSQRPQTYIKNHKPTKGLQVYENPKDNGNFKSFNDKLAERKMYDAGRNIKQKQDKKMQDIIEAAGWNPQCYFLKWEVHYIKPEKSLNNGHGIRLYNLMNPTWENIFKSDIYSQYKKIVPMKSIILPSTKSNLHALDIFAIELVETKLNDGKTKDEVKKLLYDRINASAILSKADKDSRKAQVRKTLDKLSESKESIFDISKQLQQALFDDAPQDTGQGLQE